MSLGIQLPIADGDIVVGYGGALRPANFSLPGSYLLDLGTGPLPALNNPNTQLRLASRDGQTNRIEGVAYGSASTLQYLMRSAGGTRAIPAYPTTSSTGFQIVSTVFDEATGAFQASASSRIVTVPTENHGAAAKGYGWFITGVNNGSTTQVTWISLTDARILQLSSTAPTANTYSGNVLMGVNNATADVAGQLGETTTSTVSGVAVAATGTVGNVTSISLTAGKWEIKASAVYTGGATGLTAESTAKMSIVSTSATNGTSGSTMSQQSVYALVANGLVAMHITSVVINITATTTYYLTEEVTYAAGSPTAAATIVATRIR